MPKEEQTDGQPQGCEASYDKVLNSPEKMVKLTLFASDWVTHVDPANQGGMPLAAYLPTEVPKLFCRTTAE